MTRIIHNKKKLKNYKIKNNNNKSGWLSHIFGQIGVAQTTPSIFLFLAI
jgi:hypothetical protein